MSQLELHPDWPTAVCSTCHGVLRLQARWTRARAGERTRESVERMAEEARWFAMALEKIDLCPSHGGIRRLARELARELEAVGVFCDALECA
jgi:NMD protein affecting ribosome stability and mRNA decay